MAANDAEVSGKQGTVFGTPLTNRRTLIVFIVLIVAVAGANLIFHTG